MNITTIQAQEICSILEDSGSGAAQELASEIKKALDQKKIGTGKLTEIKHCDHQWEPLSEMDVRKAGSPSMLGLKDLPEDELHEFYLQRTSKCRKCGLPYRFRTLDIESAEGRYDREFEVSVKAMPSVHYFEELQAQFDAEREQTDVSISQMKEELCRLQEEFTKRNKADL